MRTVAVILVSLMLIVGCEPTDTSNAAGDAPSDTTAAGDAPDSTHAGDAPADTAETPRQTPRASGRAGIVPTGDVPGQGLLPDGRTHVFECATAGGDSRTFTVRADSAVAWLWPPGEVRVEPVRLVAAPAASGTRYESGETVFWNKGQEATFVVVGTRLENCVRDNYRSVWEGAKLDGVDFRALGNEPGWTVDIHAGEQFDVQWRYGDRTAVLPYTEPETPDDSTTIFRSNTDDHEMTLTIAGGGCIDSMSGIEFPASVTLLINGSEYTGCGRPLH